MECHYHYPYQYRYNYPYRHYQYRHHRLHFNFIIVHKDNVSFGTTTNALKLPNISLHCGDSSRLFKFAIIRVIACDSL